MKRSPWFLAALLAVLVLGLSLNPFHDSDSSDRDSEDGDSEYALNA